MCVKITWQKSRGCSDRFLNWLARSNRRVYSFWKTKWEINSCSFPTDKAEIWNVLNGFKTYTNPSLIFIKITWQKSRGCSDGFLNWLARSNRRVYSFWNTSFEIKSCSFPTDKAEIWNVLNGFKTYTNPSLMCVKITWQKSRGCSDGFLNWLARGNRRVYSFWNTSFEIKSCSFPTDKAEIWNVLNGFKTYTNPSLMCVKITWQKSRGCSDGFLNWLARGNRRVYSFWNTSWEIQSCSFPTDKAEIWNVLNGFKTYTNP